MDLDALASARHDDWERLDVLATSRQLDGAGRRRAHRALPGRRHPISRSYRRPRGRRRSATASRSRLARARLRFTGAPENPLRQFTRFASSSLPAALYRLRWLTLAVAVVTFVVAGAVRLVDRRRPARARGPRHRGGAASSSPTRASSPTTPRTRRRPSPARSGRTTRGSPRSASRSASSGSGCRT